MSESVKRIFDYIWIPRRHDSFHEKLTLFLFFFFTCKEGIFSLPSFQNRLFSLLFSNLIWACIFESLSPKISWGWCVPPRGHTQFDVLEQIKMASSKFKFKTETFDKQTGQCLGCLGTENDFLNSSVSVSNLDFFDEDDIWARLHGHVWVALW